MSELSGSEARYGDTVSNLTTGQIGVVIGTTNGGRLLINTLSGDPAAKADQRWERWNVTVHR